MLSDKLYWKEEELKGCGGAVDLRWHKGTVCKEIGTSLCLIHKLNRNFYPTKFNTETCSYLLYIQSLALKLFDPITFTKFYLF